MTVDFLEMGLILLALVVSISIHEFAHAWSAYELGDPTPKHNGRLTLNPVVHFDPVGGLMLVFMVLSGWGIGWGRPVMVNDFNLRGDRRVSMALTAAAGPFSNLVLAALFAIPLRLGLVPWGNPLFRVLEIFVWTNLGLMLFNLIPLPPLDGFTLVRGILATYRTRWARDWGDRLDQVAAYGPLALFALLALGWFSPINPLGLLLGSPLRALWSLLLG